VLGSKMVVGKLVCMVLVLGSIQAVGSIQVAGSKLVAADSILVLDSILVCMAVDSKDRDHSSSLKALKQLSTMRPMLPIFLLVS